MLTLDLSSRTALVTGSTPGIGKVTAQQLATAGARVYVNGRTEERVEAAIAEIRKALTEAALRPDPADVAKAEGVEGNLRVRPGDVICGN